MERIIQLKLDKKLGVMLACLILLISLLLVVNQANPSVHFVDEGLENAIRVKLGNHDLPIYQNDLMTITELNAAGFGIRRLEGIESLKRLTFLDLSQNQVTDLSPLAELWMLTELDLGQNGLSDLEQVNFDRIIHLPIRVLSLRHNEDHVGYRLSDLDLLTDLHHLEDLDLRNNQITDLSPLASLPRLHTLDLRGNSISNLDPLRNLSNLTHLNLRENAIVDLKPITGLNQLIYLNIHTNPIRHGLEGLANLHRLQTLIMRNVYIGENHHFIAELTNLQRLNIRNTAIADLSMIVDLMRMGALQDDAYSSNYATVDILENRPSGNLADPYHELRLYWDNIHYRYPITLPYHPSSVKPPEFSQPSGFYSQGFYLSLSTLEPGGRIFYTTDGSEPVLTHRLQPINTTWEYSQPIEIKNRANEPDLLTDIKTAHPDRYIYFPPRPVFKGTVVRAVVVDQNGERSNRVTHTFFVDENIHERYTFPVISIATDAHRLFDDDIGIYVPGDLFENIFPNPNHDPANYSQRGLKWERPISFQMFSPQGELLLSQNAGLRIHGSGSRSYAQKSLRLYARACYDEQVLFNYDFFPTLSFRLSDRRVDTFETLILRNSGQDWYGIQSTMFKDAFLQSLLEHTHLDIQGYHPSIVFINGEYWGIHNIRTRYDQYYLSNYYGLSNDQVTVLENNRQFKFGDPDGVHHYNQILTLIDPDFIENGYQTVSTLQDPEKFAMVAEWMDIDNFLDYYVSKIYFDNTDWPGNNVLFWRKNVSSQDTELNTAHGHDGKWRWMVTDTDFGFLQPEHNTLFEATRDDGNEWFNAPWATFLVRSLLENQDFRMSFINRFADHLNTSFREEVVVDRLDDFIDRYQPEVEEQIHRWGNLGGSFDAWLENVEIFRNYAVQRPSFQREHIIEKFELPGTAGLTIMVDPSQGYFQINSLEIKDGNVGVEDAGYWTGIYFQDIPVEITVTPFEGYQFLGWEIQDGLALDVETHTIQINLTQDTSITALFGENLDTRNDEKRLDGVIIIAPN